MQKQQKARQCVHLVACGCPPQARDALEPAWREEADWRPKLAE